jgi:hypothetical protein
MRGYMHGYLQTASWQRGCGMPSLQKITYVYWVDAEGRRVKTRTTGARKVVEESKKWYACWKEGTRQKRVPLCTDKSSAQAMLADLLRTKDRTRARLIDPYQPHLDRPVAHHVEEYLVSGGVRAYTLSAAALRNWDGVPFVEHVLRNEFEGAAKRLFNKEVRAIECDRFDETTAGATASAIRRELLDRLDAFIGDKNEEAGTGGFRNVRIRQIDGGYQVDMSVTWPNFKEATQRMETSP